MTAKLTALLELHAASASLQQSYNALIDRGHVDIAAKVRECGVMVAACIAAMVKSECDRSRVAAVMQ